MTSTLLYQTGLRNDGNMRGNGVEVTVVTVDSAVLTVGDTFTVEESGRVFTFQGLVPSADAAGGGTTSGFYATSSNGRTFVFTTDDTENRGDVTLQPGGEFTICFLAGTNIATTAGLKAVEDLSIGDMVLTPSGAAVPVIWVGRQAVATRFGLRDADLPVCISAGALGENVPARDLRVTSGHAVLIDGVLVNAGALVNGSSITQIARSELGDTFTVYHIETENHDIVLAEGAPTETFIDNVTRARFDNFAEYEALFGAEGRPMEERPEPRAASHRQVPPAIQARIAARAAVLAPALAKAA